MWRITVDPDKTLEEISTALNLPAIAVTDITGNVKVIFKINNTYIYTNVDASNVMLNETLGVGAVDGDVDKITLTVNDVDYKIADLLMSYFNEKTDIMAMMMQVAA